MNKLLFNYLSISATALLTLFLACSGTNNSPQPTEVELTPASALSLLEPELPGGECLLEGVEGGYHSCKLDIVKRSANRWIITVLYDGFFDDSIKASRIQADVSYAQGKWTLAKVSHRWQCWPGRGHQDFSTKLCA